MTQDDQDYSALCNINDTLMRIAEALEMIAKPQLPDIIERCGALFGKQGCQLAIRHPGDCEFPP